MRASFLLSDKNSKSTILKKKIIRYLILSGESAIADISREIEMSVPTVTRLVVELIEEGFISDLGKQSTNGGRRPNVYGINPEAGYFVGVDVSRKRVMLGTIDFNGRKLDEDQRSDYELANTEESLANLCDIIGRYVDSLPVPKDKILQVGVSLSGRISASSGYSHSFFYFGERPLSQVIEEKTGIPTTLENDSRAMAYGEYMAGVVRGEKHILFVNLNWGLGAALILDGRLYYGKSGYSGEFGHICAFDNEVICGCGKKGCIETEASGFAMQRLLVERCRQGSTTILSELIVEKGEVSLPEFVDAVLKEDVLAIEIVEYMGLNLGRWLAGMINVLNPELVIIGGPLSQTQDYIRLPIKSAMKKYSLNLVNQDTDLVISKLGERAGLTGICLLCRSRTLDLL
ncbi:MAG: ROK family transcriptional regulator [Tannerellaceae bacterium]|jgi:predicted NBD/HSP70 family sugar kinase|nr:ROK family transcriptional regulator [Tannerellaceae bacterium]